MEDELTFPYKLIDIDTGSGRFLLSMTALDKENGFTGTFRAAYSCKGIKSDFECFVTLGDIYYFAYALDTAYDLEQVNTSAVIGDDNDLRKISLIFIFDSKGRCHVSGHFPNKDDMFRSAVDFNCELYLSVITDITVGINKLFDKLAEIKGDRDFY